MIGVDLDGDGEADINLASSALIPEDPDHEPFALVDLFQSPHRPVVPVWVNNVFSIVTYVFLLFLLASVMLSTGHEHYSETEISRYIMKPDHGDRSRTRKRGIECNCLSKLSATVEVEDTFLGEGLWTILSDVAIANAASCARESGCFNITSTWGVTRSSASEGTSTARDRRRETSTPRVDPQDPLHLSSR